jgi:hypothetical protein
MNSLKLSLIVVVSFCLSACGAYTEHFKCKAQPGLGCSSITEVNDLVNQGWPETDARKKEVIKKSSFFGRLFAPQKSKATQSCKTCALPLEDFLNHNSENLKIWIAPYKFENQYCGEQFVYSGLDFLRPTNPESFNNQSEAL